jgi:hypothetical protein
MWVRGDRNYRNAHNLRILVDEKGRVPSVSKELNYHAVLKASQFEQSQDHLKETLKNANFIENGYETSRVSAPSYPHKRG